ncbi:MFS transporter [Phenylobacterium sp.]|uniref:AmpG family muropeptide MFS transporter n=1 Tax=Phenylobacterium sp. TaxID=1871053 RepID=UPI00271A18F6|nr:MFS transporter [Phenylobacterium sp.]MDO8379148.1 MFS transporter [Phenylobacterium sp.]
MTIEAAPKRSAWSAIKVYGERRALVMLALGFASGLPNLLIFDTLSAWLRDAGLSLEVIAFFSLATLAYSLKLLWAPLIDRAGVPILTKWLGHRRSWMLVCQALIMLGLWLISGVDPKTSLGLMAAFAVFVGFTSATQDIVIDAWRIEAATTEKQGAMAAAYQWGYRIAMIVAGVVPLAMSDVVGWSLSYALMAGLMVVGVLGVLGAPREAKHLMRDIDFAGVAGIPLRDGVEWVLRLAIVLLGALVFGSGLAGNATVLQSVTASLGRPELGDAIKAAWEAKPFGVFAQVGGILTGVALIVVAALPIPGLPTRPGRYLSTALGAPFIDFFRRYGDVAGLILALICVYRLSDFVLNIMNPFYIDLGFDKLQIAEVRKVLGVVMSVIGVGLGGFSVARLGLMRSMVIGAFAGPISNLVFAWLAFQGPDLWALSVAIGVDNIASGFAGTCLIAYMSSLTGEGFTATQYAMFSSFYALLGKLVASQSGKVVEGAAKAADQGGAFSGLKALFTGLPPRTFASAVEKSGVTPAALGSGYVVFFVYSALLGVVGIILVFMVAARTPKTVEEPASDPETA